MKYVCLDLILALVGSIAARGRSLTIHQEKKSETAPTVTDTVATCQPSSIKKANWRSSFDKKDWSEADGAIVGMMRNSCNGLECIEEVSYVDIELTGCSEEDWLSKFDNKGMHLCPQGKFLKGIYRNSCSDLYCIEQVRCCQQKNAQAYAGACQKANWWSSFDEKGWSSCPRGTAVAGLMRNSCNKLYCIEEATCCPYASSCGVAECQPSIKKANWWSSFDKKNWSEADGAIVGIMRNSCDGLECIEEVNYVDIELTGCSEENWLSKFDKEGMHLCPQGKFLKGIYRNSCNDLYCIEQVRCCHQKNAQAYAGACQKANWRSSFDKKGWSSCPKDTAVAGLMRSSCNKLYCIEEATCCPYVPSCEVANQPSSIKTANWQSSFDKKDWSEADGAIVGIMRDSCNGLDCIEEVNYVDIELTGCSDEDWLSKFDHKGMHLCPQGKFLKGIYRNSCNDLHCIEQVRCCHQKNSIVYAGACQIANWWSSFDEKGWSSCPEGTAVAGLMRNTCDKLYCIEEATCCPYASS